MARIGIAAAQASMYTADYSQRHMLHGPDGVFPRDRIVTEGTFNIYLLGGQSTAAFEVIYHVGLALCVAMMLGVGGRATIALVWAASWSLWGANPMLVDGGDNLSMVVMPMLAISMCCERLSVRFPGRRMARLRELFRGWFAVLLSNAAAFGVMVQLCIVYFASGMYKAQGPMWIDGTALYYTMRTPEYFYPHLSPMILDNDVLIVAGTYAAMVLLIGFPFLVLSPRTRLWAVLAMMGFHASIGLFMGLTSFALVMLACDCVFVSGHVQRALGGAVSLARTAVGRARRRLPGGPLEPEPAGLDLSPVSSPALAP